MKIYYSIILIILALVVGLQVLGSTLNSREPVLTISLLLLLVALFVSVKILKK